MRSLSFASVTMNADLGFHEATYGLAAGMFSLGYALGQARAPGRPAPARGPRRSGGRATRAATYHWGGCSCPDPLAPA